MNKLGVRSIIVLMTVVLIGLISIQVYWIKSAIELKAQQFDQEVHETLHLVSQKLEKQDAVNYLLDEFFSGNLYDNDMDRKVHAMHNKLVHGNLFNEDVDVIFAEMEKEIEDMKQMSWMSKSPSEQFSFEYDTIITVDSSGKGMYYGSVSIQVNDQVHDFCVASTNKRKLRRSVNERVRKITNQKNLVNDIFFQFFNNDRSLTERIDTVELEQLVSVTLEQKGLDLPYNYAVVNSYGQIETHSPDFNTNSGAYYQTALFPNDISAGSSHLMLQFPSKRSYIMKSLGVMSFSSIGLILIISMCFAYAIHIIFQQKKLSDMKTDFINNMTHEFKTPVATISLASELLKDDKIATDKDKLNKYANVIFDENKRLGSQVEKVLQMAVLDKGELDLKLNDINVHEQIEKVIDKLSLQIENKGGHISANLNAINPMLQADEAHFIGIIFNLLDNAIKYSPEEPKIAISTRDRSRGIEIKISDNGIGMSKEVQKRIFEKFYRVPTGNRHDVKGFGLGLSYVRAMVAAHGGTISVNSEPGKGSTFELFFPHQNTIS